MDKEELGTIIAQPESPSTTKFSFIVQTEKVRKGQFVTVETPSGLLLGLITNIFKTNKYFEDADSVKNYSEISTTFPIGEWECTIANVKILSNYNNSTDSPVERVNYPPSPGSKVFSAEPSLLTRFLGLDQSGLFLGKVMHHQIDAKINMTKLLQKHLAILAMSGAGKSYLVSVLIEELLSRAKDQPKIAVLVFDNHGEYLGFAQTPEFSKKTKIINAEDIKIGLRHFSGKAFSILIPELSEPQLRELGKVIGELNERKEAFDLDELIAAIETNESIKSNLREILVSQLEELKQTDLFAKSDSLDFEELLKPGELTIINFANVSEQHIKQLIVYYLTQKLFRLRQKQKVPPYLEIIEEAHNFAPEKVKAKHALSKNMIELLAREGRKFFASLCLVSQRPIHLSTTALSQCNTQIFLRITNPYDLDHIGKSSEALTPDVLDSISGLRVGEALIVGEATNWPVFIRVRKRISKEVHGESLESYASYWEKSMMKKLAKGAEFL